MQEAINNAVRHGAARTVTVRARETAITIELSVADDTTVGAYTSIDGHKWMEKAEAYAIESRVNVTTDSDGRSI